MHRFLPGLLLCLTTLTANAQIADDWRKLRDQAHSIGVDSLCPQPDPACLTRYFTQIIYGRTPRRMSYQGLPERVDTVRINRLTLQFLDGADWCPLLDSLESKDRHYRQLTAYCMRCLADDYMADSLTVEQVQDQAWIDGPAS